MKRTPAFLALTNPTELPSPSLAFAQCCRSSHLLSSTFYPASQETSILLGVDPDMSLAHTSTRVQPRLFPRANPGSRVSLQSRCPGLPALRLCRGAAPSRAVWGAAPGAGGIYTDNTTCGPRGGVAPRPWLEAWDHQGPTFRPRILDPSQHQAVIAQGTNWVPLGDWALRILPSGACRGQWLVRAGRGALLCWSPWISFNWFSFFYFCFNILFF